MNFRTFTVAAVFTASLTAQWLKYPTAGIPRTPNGKPNLSAPAPRTADGKPDLSGIWELTDDRPCLPDCVNSQSGQEFLSIGRSLKEGLPYKPGMKELAKQRNTPPKLGEPITQCLPIGIVERHTHGSYRKVVQTPGLLLMLNEMNAGYRQVFTDNRPFPDDPTPSWQGYSSAKWEGDTLVISSIGFRDDLWIDWNGSMITSSAKVQERIRRPDYGHLTVEVTVDDPKAYTKPWSVTLRQRLAINTELVDEICLENEKSLKRMK